MAKISKRHMIAHLNKLNKEGKLNLYEQNKNFSKKVKELDEIGVVL